MGPQTRADTVRESAASLMPITPAVTLRRQRPKRTDPAYQLVPGQWAEIQTIGVTAPLRGFVFSLRQSEVLFTFPELTDFPVGLEPGRSVVVTFQGRTGRHTGHAAVLRAAKGPPVTVAIQHLSNIETEQRRRYPRVSLQIPATLEAGPAGDATPQSDERARIRNLGAGGMLLETSLALAEGDDVNVTLPESHRVMQNQGARHVRGKVLRVESAVAGRRKPKVASVEFSFDSDDERDGWARLVLAQTRKGR
jgi:hypothetical protein